jgi:hypothetical protein
MASLIAWLCLILSVSETEASAFFNSLVASLIWDCMATIRVALFCFRELFLASFKEFLNFCIFSFNFVASSVF